MNFYEEKIKTEVNFFFWSVQLRATIVLKSCILINGEYILCQKQNLYSLILKCIMKYNNHIVNNNLWRGDLNRKSQEKKAITYEIKVKRNIAI